MLPTGVAPVLSWWLVIARSGKTKTSASIVHDSATTPQSPSKAKRSGQYADVKRILEIP
jgi:hypothetical protein